MQMSTKAELDEANLFKRAGRVIALVWRVHEGGWCAGSFGNLL